MVQSNNSFTFNLYNKLAETDGANFTVSPLSATMALSLLANGTRNETLDEITEVLGYEAVQLPSVNKLNARISSELPAIDRKTRLTIANSIWIDSDFKVKNEYIAHTSDYYGVSVFNRELSSEKTKQEINYWCKEHTNGLIPEFLNNPLPDDTKLLLFNVLYFKSEWATPFDKAKTAEASFYNADATTAVVNMMKAEMEALAAYDTDGATWVVLSFGNGAFQMVLILPDKRTDLNIDSYMAAIGEQEATDMLNGMEWYELKISLPKFRTTTDIPLNSILMSMGMTKPFSDAADFSGISDAELSLTTAKQTVTFEIDEKGAEAASVTHIAWAPTATASELKKKEVIFDHPFAFFVREASTSAIIFAGGISQL